jgi:PAS domain S-box-containing protein
VRQPWRSGNREEKRQSESMRLNRMLEAAANAIMITGRDGRIAWVNPAFTRLTGFSLGEVWGQNPRLLKSGKHEQSFYENMWETILSGQVWRGEIINRRKDGSLYTEDLTITPVRNEHGSNSIRQTLPPASGRRNRILAKFPAKTRTGSASGRGKASFCICQQQESAARLGLWRRHSSACGAMALRPWPVIEPDV